MKRATLLILCAILFFPTVVCATTNVTVYVGDTDNDNCVENDEDECDYPSLAMAEDDQDGDITANGRDENIEIVCYPTDTTYNGPDVSTVMIYGFITDATHKVTIRGSEAIGTTWDNTKYHLNPSATAHGIDNWSTNITFKDLQIYNNTQVGNIHTFRMTGGGYPVLPVQIERCILAQGDRSTHAGRNIWVKNVETPFNIINNIIYVEDGSSASYNLHYEAGSSPTSTADLYFVNNTVYGGYYGAYIIGYFDATVYNNIFQEHTESVSYLESGSNTFDMDYNICEDEDCTDGANDQEEEVSFADEDNYDFALEEDSPGDGDGDNFYPDITDDVEQDSRPSTGVWDTGADEN